MKLTSLLARLAVALACFAVGVFVGYPRNNNVPNPELQKLAEAVAHQSYAFEQYRHGDYGPAHAALLDDIRLLDSFSAEPGRPVKNCFAEDAMFDYVRLAKLEERYERDGAGAYIREAASRCERLGRANCAESYLRNE